MEKSFRKKKFFYALGILVCLLGMSENAWATNYYKIRVVAVYASGETPCPGRVFSYPYSGSGITYSESLCVASEFTTPTYSTTGNPDVYICAADVAGVAEFLGWYTDPACTVQASRSPTSKKSNQWGSNSGIAVSTVEAEAPTTTFYAKFVKPSVDWSGYASAPSAGKYYIFGLGYNALIGTTSGTSIAGTKEVNNALLFTFTSGTTTTMSCVIDGKTYYLDQNGTKLEETSSPKEKTFEAVDGGYNVNLHRSSYSYWEMEANGKLDFENKSNNTTLKWLFIPEAAFNSFVSVESLNENGSVTITESPTASGTAYVKFNVSEIGPVVAYNYALSGGDGNWTLGNPTRSGNVLSVPVTYTAHSVHTGSAPASTVTVTVTDPASTSVSGTATAYVDLQPTFNMAVSELDWSYEGETLTETYYVGMEVAASQRERLQNKLVYNVSTTNAIARNNATWTATITGTDAAQFKFADGTREVSGSYAADLMDVIFAPQATGTFTATLHVVASYTDASNPAQTLTCTRDVTLKGKGELTSLITFAVNGSEEASNNESHNFGDIIGTNAMTVTADLFMVGLTSPTKVWSDPDGAFEFNESSIDLGKKNQTLTFRAHRTTPIASAANHTATLTISGTGTEGPVSAVLTLTYHALPLTQTTVTWNWATLGEYVTAANPVTTNSDGEWTLVKTAGDAMTYDAEAKTVTTDYLHHEPGHMGTFSLSIPQTDTYTAFSGTYTVTIDAFAPPVIEINSQAKFDTYVEGNSWVDYDASLNAVDVTLDNVYFKWSGQSTIAFDFYMSGSYTSSNWRIKEMYKDGTVKQIYDGPFYNGQHHEFAISSGIDKLWLYGSNYLRNVRYFEYDTIAANYDEVVLVDDNGAIGVLDVNATLANKKAVTVSLNPAAQPYFELRAAGKSSGSSIVFNGEDGLGVHLTQDVTVTVAAKAGLTPAQVEAAKTATANNQCNVVFADNYTYNQETLTLPIRLIDAYDVTYKKHAHGTYTVTYEDDTEHPHSVTSADFVKRLATIAPEHCTVTLSAPTPASGYVFQGWKINGVLVSCASSVTKVLDEAATVEPVFAVADGTFKIDDALFSELSEALGVASAIADQNPVVVLMKDHALTTPATYTIPAGVTLLVPYKANFSELQIVPEMTLTATTLSAYRTLTLTEGVNIVCNGNICVSGKIMAAGGGNKSAYTTGECGVINMANGGHIELNNGAELYCWGYIKGQDMDQGNNTQDVGTVTVNSGAIVHENFELGDWRGGTATSNIYYEKDEKMLFPFQSYALQNVEIPTTYKYGSELKPYLIVHTGYGDPSFEVTVVGSENSLFLLKDAGSVIRKWYDPTTDLSCYELSGTAQLDQLILNLPLVGNFESGDCNLPISNSMHIMLANCNMTLSTPLTVQAGAVIEIKNTATVNLTAKVHMFDVDEWGLYIHNYYFRSFNNLTSHKNRGAENSKAGLDDAKFIIDGTLNVVNGQGYIYSTAGGGNLMGNGGGVINFQGALPTADEIWQVNVLSGSPYITWVSTPETAANLCNEDGSYTRSIGNATFHNINGRWFHASDKDAKTDHTYKFTYMNDGNSGEDVETAAVYSHDKTGLEARMKWFNVAADACANWWTGTSPAALYNYSMLNDWHQFMETETTNVYSGSDNVLYQKAGCGMVAIGEVDENCLYTFDEGGNQVKKALVDGNFIPLTPNGNDPAYHATANASQYYICFTGCNWHPATPYTGESKAYTIHPEDEDLHYIWFNNDWLNVQREEPFFYTADELTNVKTYYEYVNGEWAVATPFVRVEDALETREFYMIHEAFTVAALKKNATITILKDIPNVTSSLVFSTQNTTCTLDLNGHIVTGACANLLNVNAPGSTFIIVDNSTYHNGELRAMPSANSRQVGYTVTAGTLRLESGKLYATNAMERQSSGNTNVRISGISITKGATFTMTGGEVECIDEYNNYGIVINGDASTKGVMNFSGGKVVVHATKWDSPYGILVQYGRLNMSGTAAVECYADASSTAYGVSVSATASYNASNGSKTSYGGEFNMTGGSIYAYSYTSSTRGLQVNGAVGIKGNYNAAVPDNTVMVRGYGVANISGGTITSETRTTQAFGVLSYGTTNISGGTITANVPASQNTAWGVRVDGGTTTISGTANITANAPTIAYGALVQGVNGSSTIGWPHVGVLNIQGGTITANTTSSTRAYGLYVTGTTYTVSRTDGYSVFNGDYAAAGTATVTGGTFNVNAKTSTSNGIFVANTVTKNAASATPVCTINGGKYLMTGTSDVQGCNAAAQAANFKINGGIYSHDGNLATYANAEANKIVVTLPKTDANYPDYKYEVAEGYTITFKNGEETLQTTAQKTGTTPTYNGAEPTKASTEEKSYVFDGWSATDGGDVVALATVSADATYFAHFNETTLKYRVTLDAQTNGGVEETQIIYVDPASAIGTLPTATKAGYTFQGWYSVAAATGGEKLEESTEINEDALYYARFAINQHTLTWNLNGGKVTTAGTVVAKDAEGSPSGLVDYKATITAPVVAKAGYTFKNWGVAVATTMPDNDLTYTAAWTPKTNTAYAVKHFKQDLDGTYPAEPAETDNLTGTTDAYVTPAVKTYDGFISPSTQTVQIAGNGGLVVSYQYARRTYTITFNATANGGTCATTSMNVRHGATLTLPDATKAGYNFTGWFTKAVGGDQITNETVIQRNIGTLYAQFVNNNLTVSTPMTISDTRTVADLLVKTTGKLNITGHLTANNLILESNAMTASGQLFFVDDNLTINGNAYLDMKLNAQRRTWYGVAVPWRVSAQDGVYGDGKRLVLGKDFDIVWYDGEVRAAMGPVAECYKYLEDIGEPANRIIEPGRMYFMFFARPYNVIRFQKKAGESLVNYTVPTDRYKDGAGDITDKGWNGIANPGLTHVTIPDATPNRGYRYKNVNMDENKTGQWQLVTDISAETFVVGQPIMVQLPADGGIKLTMSPVAYAVAPAPVRKMAANGDIDRAEVLLTSQNGATDRILCLVDDEAVDEYTIGQDLVKFTNDDVPQLWIRNYKHALAVNTVRAENNTATYPLTIVSPKAGDYTLSLVNKLADGIHLYLTLNGEAIADLTEGEYTLPMGKETNKAYGLRLVRGPRGTVTGVDEALDGKDNAEKVIMNGMLFIIRQGKMYDAQGRLIENR